MISKELSYTKGDIKRAGNFLRDEMDAINIEEYNHAYEVLGY